MDTPVLDYDALADHMGPLGEHAPEVITLWLESIDERVDAIRVAAQAGDAQALAMAVHTLRGSSMYLGAVRLTDACAEIEHQLRAGRLANAMDSVIYRVEQDAATTAAALRDHRAGLLLHGAAALTACEPTG